MGKLKGLVAILLIASLAATSLMVVESVSAQSIPKPSVPEFSLQIIDHSYDVPEKTTHYTEPYTNKTTTNTIPGYHVSNKTIEVKIRNQPFTPYSDASSQKTINLYYNVSTKPHYGDTWTYQTLYYGEKYYIASTSEYTILDFYFTGDFNSYTLTNNIGYVPDQGEVDFRVQAMIGYYHNEWVSHPSVPYQGSEMPMFTGRLSDWSNIKTIKIDKSIPAPAPTPNTSFTQESTNIPAQNSTTPEVPVQTPKANATQPVTQTDVVLGLDLDQVVIASMAVIIVSLATALVFMNKRRIREAT